MSDTNDNDTNADTTTTDTNATSTESATTEQQSDADSTTDASEDTSANSEAARYRVKLRETEAERDGLAQRLTAMQRRECEAAVADLLEIPADLWDLGKADPTGFYDDGDTLDAAELRAAVDDLLKQRPGLAKTAPRGRPSWGQHSGPGPASAVGWSQVINSV